MSVTLFFCSQCNSYARGGATVKIMVAATLDAKRGVLWISNVSVDGGRRPLEDIVESHCSDCGSLTQWVVLDKCPHQWQVFYSDCLRRVCGFCGEVQRGHVAFDE